MIREQLTARVGIFGTADMPVNFAYDKDNPYTVAITGLAPNQRPVTWLVARDILFDGLHTQAGDGDVVIAPFGMTVSIYLTSPTGSAVLFFDRQPLAAFLRSTHLVVPVGDEERFLDWSDAAEWIPEVSL